MHVDIHVQSYMYIVGPRSTAMLSSDSIDDVPT